MQPQPHGPASHFDPESLRSDLFDSPAALRTVLTAFGPWLADTRARLYAAVARDDRKQAAAVAHTLRGGLAQMRAEAAVARVRALEAICRDGATHPLPTEPCLHALNEELDALAHEVADLLTSINDADPKNTFAD